jgi:Predicted transcriptional regulators
MVDRQNNPRVKMEDAKHKIENLAENIEEIGQLHPIMVEEIEENRYKLIAGYRRYQAIMLLNEKFQGKDNPYSEILAIVKDKVDDRTFIALSENLARKDMTEEEKAKAIYEYITKTKDTRRKTAERFGISKTYADKLYHDGEALANLSNVTTTESKTAIKSFNSEQIPEIMKTASETINSLKNRDGLTTKEKFSLMKTSKEVIIELQNMIAYLRESGKQLSRDSDIKQLIKEQEATRKENVSAKLDDRT